MKLCACKRTLEGNEMNWCQPHWTQLREMIEKKGLSHLVAANGQAAAQAMVEGTFEPLLWAWSSINEQMSKDMGGLFMGCPCCQLVNDKQPHLVEDWLDGATDGVLKYAREKGLVTLQ